MTKRMRKINPRRPLNISLLLNQSYELLEHKFAQAKDELRKERTTSQDEEDEKEKPEEAIEHNFAAKLELLEHKFPQAEDELRQEKTTSLKKQEKEAVELHLLNVDKEEAMLKYAS